MRQARPGRAWSLGRVAARAHYSSYMQSPAWWERRRRWVDEWRETVGSEPVCLVCGKSWKLSRVDLHHATYERLGAELFVDLVPLCRPCHAGLHRVLESSPGWRQMGRASATRTIIARMRVLVERRAGSE